MAVGSSSAHPAVTPSDVPAPAVTGAEFRAVMGTVCSHVTVATTIDGTGTPHGTTVSAFASLSLDPPMVTLALDRASRLLKVLRESRLVAINLLAADQDALARRFATKSALKFDGVTWSDRGGAAILDGVSGWLVCEVAEFVEGGDHLLLLCRVRSAGTETKAPLVYGNRQFGTHSALLGG